MLVDGRKPIQIPSNVLLDNLDHVLDLFWNALGEEDRQMISNELDQDANAEEFKSNRWASDVVKRLEGLDGCLRREEIRRVRIWIEQTLMPCVGANGSLAKLATKLDVRPRTLQQWYERGYLKQDAAEKVFKAVRDVVAALQDCPEGRGVLPSNNELPMISTRFRHIDESRKSASKPRRKVKSA